MWQRRRKMVSSFSLLPCESPIPVKGNPDKKNINVCIPLDLGHKLNVHKMFRRRPGHLLNTLHTLNLRPVPREESYFLQ